jgi:hypothetical protein
MTVAIFADQISLHSHIHKLQNKTTQQRFYKTILLSGGVAIQRAT